MLPIRKNSKRNFSLYLLFVIFSAVTLSLSSADLGSSPWYGSATGDCGIWVEVEVTLDGTELTVMAAGGPGSKCTWDKLVVTVSMRNASTGLWEYLDGFNGPATQWDDSFSVDGYDAFKVVVEGYDTEGTEPHHVSTTVQDSF